MSRMKGLTAVKTNATAAAKKLLPRFLAGKVRGGEYIHGHGEQRCAIGWLYSEEQAKVLNTAGSDYKLITDLLDDGDLIVPERDRDWFITLQQTTDNMSMVGTSATYAAKLEALLRSAIA